MKSILYVEYQNKQIEESTLLTKVKEVWVNDGNKIKDIQTLQLYVKPEEYSVYYVINDSYSGQIPMVES